MKVFILVDKNKIVRCMASLECNLHKDKLKLRKYYVEREGTVGDEYNARTKKWKARPENYPKPNEAEIAKRKIRKEMRQMAIERLKERGELNKDYKDSHVD